MYPTSERTTFLDLTGGLNNGNDWVMGDDMGEKLNGHCLAGIDDNRALIMGGKWRLSTGGWNTDGLVTVMYDLLASQR